MNYSENAVDRLMEEAVTRMNQKKPDSPLQLLSQVLGQQEGKKSPTPVVGTRPMVLEMDNERSLTSPKKRPSKEDDRALVNSLIQELFESSPEKDDSMIAFVQIGKENRRREDKLTIVPRKRKVNPFVEQGSPVKSSFAKKQTSKRKGHLSGKFHNKDVRPAAAATTQRVR